MRNPLDVGRRARPFGSVRRTVAVGGALCGVAAVLALAVPLWNAPPAIRAAPPLVRLASGSPGFNPLGNALLSEYRRVLPGMQIEAHSSAGSLETVQALQRGSADIGPALANVAYLAYVGQLPEIAAPLDRLRGIAALQMTPLHIVVRPGVHVRGVPDLRGRRVAIGPAGTGTALTSQIVVQGYGFTLRDIVAEQLPPREAALRLLAGTLDAFVIVAPYPVDSVTMALRHGATLLDVAGPPVERLRSEYPFLQVTFLPAGTYPGQPDPIRTIGIDHVLLCRADLDDEIVYALTRSLFQVLPALSSQNVVLRLIDADRAPATPIPLHEGAERYYRERELTR